MREICRNDAEIGQENDCDEMIKLNEKACNVRY